MDDMFRLTVLYLFFLFKFYYLGIKFRTSRGSQRDQRIFTNCFQIITVDINVSLNSDLTLSHELDYDTILKFMAAHSAIMK